ncbi:uncharacterized protein LOC112901640 isoform X1 [Panicum hallii]|uniref:uncharacterized protein LOC112901640 isoform X1 n=1 Tax=Panicum hallii TaxID=206008 RepID=UPI000DF4DDE3|nr:uncharacterized protein LOC112901640 isoform X1 [Panicum hallii]
MFTTSGPLYKPGDFGYFQGLLQSVSTAVEMAEFSSGLHNNSAYPVAADGLAVSSGQGTDVDESGYASSEPSPHDVYADDEGCMNELTMEQGGAVVSGEGSASDTRLQSDQHQQSRHGYSEPTTRCDKQRK